MPGLPGRTPEERKSKAVQLIGKSKVRNKYFECRFDSKTGAITSLRRLTGTRLGPETIRGDANQLAMSIERHDKCTAWVLDPEPSKPQRLKADKPVVVLQDDIESVSWMAEFTWGNSSFRMVTTVHAQSPRIDCRVEADWVERGTVEKGCPMLRMECGLAGAPDKLACDVPFGVVTRAAGQEVPAQKWADVAVPGGGLALLNSGKYGHSLVEGVLKLGLLRTFVDPDRLPDVGRHVISWALLPHAGGWLDAGLPRVGAEYNVPLRAWQARSQKGSVPAIGSAISVDGDSWLVVTGVKRSEDGTGVVVRAYDASGRGATGVLTLARPAKRAIEVDLLEDPVRGTGNVVACNGGAVQLKVKPWGIVSVMVKV